MRDPFLLAVLVVAAVLRLYGIDHGLPFVYNPDEANIMARSLAVARGVDPGYYLYPSFFFYFLFSLPISIILSYYWTPSCSIFINHFANVVIF